MFNRIRRAWKLSKMSDVVFIDRATLRPEIVESLKANGASLMVALKDSIVVEIGDGKAEFFSDPTAADELEHKREMDGTKPWYKRLQGL